MATRVLYEFGDYQLKPDDGLYRGGEYVPCPPKELAFLRALVQLNGEIAKSGQIDDQVWPGQNVSYASIARCVYSLRRILDTDPKAYIQTVPKQGYRLAVPVRRIDPTESRPTAEKTTRTSPLAYSHYLEGLREANRQQPEALARAVELLEEAVRVDPDYAVALAAIADCRIYQTIRGYLRPADGERLALQACERALAIDPNLVSARAAFGWLEGVMRRDTEAGLTALDEALALDRDYARGHSYRAWVLRGAGRLDEAVEATRTAVKLDPHSILNKHALGWSLFCAGSWQEALEVERAVRQDQPHVDLGHAYVAIMAAWLGLYDEAIAAGRQTARITAKNPAFMTALSYALAKAGEADEARSIADSAASATLPWAPKPHVAMTYAALGDAERVVELLRDAREEHCPWFPGARFDPRLDALADDPRVQVLYG